MTTREAAPECEVPLGERREFARRELTSLAKRLGPGGRFPTILELCSQLSVSKATVDAVVKELRQAGLVHGRRGSGIYVAESVGVTHIGLVFAHDYFVVGGSPFYAYLLDHCQRRAESRREQYSLFIGTPSMLVAHEGQLVNRDLLRALKEQQLDALLLVGSRWRGETEWLAGQGMPFVAFSKGRPSDICRVHYDSGQIAAMGTDALAQQGCRRIALITPLRPLREEVACDDIALYTQMLARHGLSARPEWVWDKHSYDRRPQGDWHPRNEQNGYQAGVELLAAGERPDAIVCLDDMMTRGVLGALSEHGLEVGRDIQIATHVNQGAPGFAGYHDRLVMLEVSADAIADAIFSMLETQMRGEVPEPRHVLVPPTVLKLANRINQGVPR